MILVFDTFKSSFRLLPFGKDSELPLALKELDEGQPRWVQQKTERYYEILVRHKLIDPRTVTPEEFIAKSAQIAKNDPTFDDWADRMIDTVVAFDTQMKSSRDTREQERQAYKLDFFLRSRELDEALARRRAEQTA